MSRTPVFTVEAARLDAALRSLVAIAPRSAVVPITANVLIEAGADGSVRLTANNLDVMASRSIAAEVDTPGRTTMGVHRLQQIAASVENGSQLRIAVGEGGAAVTAGRARFRVGVLSADDFPPMPFEAAIAEFEIEGRALHRALATVRNSICTQEARYWLCGVYIHVADGLLHFVTTDGDRMSRASVPAPAGAEGLTGAIVSPLVAATAMQAGEGCDEPIRLEVSADKIRITSADVVVTGRLIDGVYPDYTRAMSADWPHSATIDRDGFEAALGRVLLVEDGKSRVVRCAFDGERVTLSSSSAGDQATEELPCAFDGEPVTIGFNGTHLRESLRALAADVVTLGINGALDPVMMISPSRADAALVLSAARI